MMQLAMAKLILSFFKKGPSAMKPLLNLAKQSKVPPEKLLVTAKKTVEKAEGKYGHSFEGIDIPVKSLTRAEALNIHKKLTRAEKLRMKPTVQDKLNEINNNPEMIDNIMDNLRKAMKLNVKKYNK